MIDTNVAGPAYYLWGTPDIKTPPGMYITDTANWTLVSGIYHAAGGEQWLTVGRFYTPRINYILLYSPPNNDINTIPSACYMLVDDVCVIDMSHPVISDTAIYTPQFPITIGVGKPDGEYLWNNGDTSLQITVSAAGTYTRQRWSGSGYYTDKFTVSETPIDFCVWLPSAFTPNGDGKNDVFGPGDNYCHPDFSDYSFNIYNRWGQMVFQSVNAGEKWDGRFGGVLQETGVYFYTLRYMYAGAFASKNKSQSMPAFVKGDVTLIR
jgi:gliding motility-associated-like protein